MVSYTGQDNRQIIWARGERMGAGDRVLTGDAKVELVAEGLSQTVMVRDEAQLNAVLVRPNQGGALSAHDDARVAMWVLGGEVRLHAEDQAQVTVRAVEATVVLDIEGGADVRLLLGDGSRVIGRGTVLVCWDQDGAEFERVDVVDW